MCRFHRLGRAKAMYSWRSALAEMLLNVSTTIDTSLGTACLLGRGAVK